MLTKLPKGAQTKHLKLFFYLPLVSTRPVMHLELRISQLIFEKKWNGPKGMLTIAQGLGGNWFMKKTWSWKARGTVPLNERLTCIVIYLSRWPTPLVSHLPSWHVRRFHLTVHLTPIPKPTFQYHGTGKNKMFHIWPRIASVLTIACHHRGLIQDYQKDVEPHEPHKYFHYNKLNSNWLRVSKDYLYLAHCQQLTPAPVAEVNYSGI